MHYSFTIIGNSIKNAMWNEFLSLIYPKTCPGCNEVLMKNENSICTSCLTELSKTDYCKYHANPVSKMFWGRIKLETATSVYCYSKESKIQKLIHALKYKDKTQIGELLGVELGKELLKSKVFRKVDMIIPVPLHRRKEKERGYNQSYFIAKGVSKVLNVPVNSEVLVRDSFNASQTNKTRYDRWLNVNSVFLPTNKVQLLSNKHVLIVDDVITTGATIEGCVTALQEIEGLKISVATLAKS